jgi:hypothetical protein
MSGRVTASPEIVFINQSLEESNPKFDAQQSVALINESNKLKASAAEHAKRAAEAQKGINACKERISQSSANVGTLTDRQKKIEEAKLKVLQRKNS